MDEQEYDEAGVDLTLIDAELRLTPAQRIDGLEAWVNEMLEIEAVVRAR